MCYYLHMPPDYWHTDKHLRLVMTLIDLCWKCWQASKQMDLWTDRVRQTLPKALSPCFAKASRSMRQKVQAWDVLPQLVGVDKWGQTVSFTMTKTKSPWVIKNSCTGWGSRKWHHQLRDYNRRTKARCRTVPNPRCRTGAHMLFTKICKCFLTHPKEASVGHIAWNATHFSMCNCLMLFIEIWCILS